MAKLLLLLRAAQRFYRKLLEGEGVGIEIQVKVEIQIEDEMRFEVQHLTSDL